MPNYRIKKTDHVDQTNRISFKFDGKTYFGFKGDTLASALLANGIHLVGRSFKYHRPRGIMTCGSEEPNAICQINGKTALTEPNVRATEIELYEGLEADSQNCWPNVNFDIGGINNFISPFIPAGFYYKTFMWPKSFWKNIYEPLIRKTAGLGKSPTVPDPEIYDHRHVHCDILIIGGGISGIMSAKLAAKNNFNTILVDDKNSLGGSTIYQNNENFKIDNKISKNWLLKEIEELTKFKNLKIKVRTSLAAYHSYNYLLAKENLTDHLSKDNKNNKIRQRLWKIRAKKVIIATGSIERPLVFNNNDRPGIILANSVNKYLNFYGVACGLNNFIFTNNDSAYETAIEFKKNNINPIILDTRKNPESEIISEAKNMGIEIKFSYVVVAAKGYKKVNSAEIANISEDKKDLGKIENITCDCICVSGFWTPTIHLASQSGNKTKFNEEIDAFVPGKSKQNETTVGSANGIFSLEKTLTTAFEKGHELSKKITNKDNKISVPQVLEKKFTQHDKFWCVPLPKEKNYKRFLDFQNDVTVSDVELALREGYRSIEHVKRYTTLGMATDQGKTSNLNGLQLVSSIQNKIVPSVGHTTFRPPYTPVSIGAIVGREIGKHSKPTRKSPIHSWHEKHNAVFVDAGIWLRPRYYKQGNEGLFEASKREAENVRKNVGVCDVTTLGKIDVKGPDAAEFLNRVYTNSWLKLPVGKARYGVMLREDGIVMDDGTTTRISEHHYHMTTTTAQAANVLSHLEYYLQIVWPELKVNVVSTTEQWAGAAIAGPKSRNLLQKLFPDTNVSNEGLPFMGYLESNLFGIPARIFRISFSGELAYEVNVESDNGNFMWEKIIEIGKEFAIQPYGTEALSTLRIEMGHVAGSELDGRTIPYDNGLDGLVSKKKDFIGKRSLNRKAFTAQDRQKVVGVVPLDKKTSIPEGSHLVKDANAKLPNPKLGHISASCWSVEYNNPFSLAILKDGKNMIGKKLFALCPVKNKSIPVEIVSSHYVDPKGERVRS